MAFSKITEHIDELNQGIRAYVDAKLDYLELSFLKKTAKLYAKMASMMMAGFLFIMFLGMLSIAVAIVIGRALEELSLGFFIVSGFYLILSIVIFIFRKRLFRTFGIKKISKKLSKMRGNKSEES